MSRQIDRRFAALCVVTCVTLAAYGAGQEPGGTHRPAGRAAAEPVFLQAPSIVPNPNRSAPLAAIVDLVVDRPVRPMLEVSDGVAARRVSYDGEMTARQTLSLVGLSPSKRYSIAVTVTDRAGRRSTWPERLAFSTDPLPADFPPLRVRTSVPEEREPGVTLFNAGRLEGPFDGLLIAVDERGEVVWYFRAKHAIGSVTPLANGNVLYLHRAGAVEIDWLGNAIRQWHPTGLGGSGPAGSIPVGVDTFHHDVCELPSGNLLLLGTELRSLDGYPTSENDPSAPVENADVVADLVVELGRDGRIVHRWSLFDLLDPYRIGYGSLGGIWNSLYGDPENGTRDWTHGNAVFYDESEDTILLSLRHQDALVLLSRRTGALQWILGDHGGWNAPWDRYLLDPVGDLQWPYHQHASVVTPEGTILLFDNGNFRARPFEPATPMSRSYSRVVEYKVDADRRTVSQVWSYGGTDEEAFYSPVGCSAYWLPRTRNVLVTDGYRITDAEGKPVENAPGARRWARVLELTHTRPARKVFELIVGDESDSGRFGWSIYRSRHVSSMVPPAPRAHDSNGR
jgi:hypothetical protein